MPPTEDEVNQAISDVQNDLNQDLEDVTQTIKDTQKEFTNKLSQQNVRVDELQGVTDRLDGKIDTIQDDLDKKVNDLDEDLSYKIEFNASSIDILQDEIEAKVSSDVYEKDIANMTEIITSNTGAINILEDEIDLRVTTEEMERVIDELEIDGRNLLRNSDFEKGEAHWKISTGQAEFKDNRVFIGNDSGIFQAVDVSSEETLTVQAYARGTGELSIRFGREVATRFLPLEEEFTRIELTFKKSGNNNIVFEANGSAEIEIEWVKLEKGTRATPWSPAPEDTNEAISDAIKRVSSTESSIEILEESITSKVDRSELTSYVDKDVYERKVSSIEQDLESITSNVTDISQEVDSVTGDITSINRSMSEIEQKADNVSIMVGEVRDDLDGLEIGGRNLLPNSDKVDHWRGYQEATFTVEKVNMSDEWGFSDAYRMTSSGGTHNTHRMLYTTSGVFSMAHDQMYTYSVYIKNVGDTDVKFLINGLGYPSSFSDEIIKPEESKRLVFHGTRRKDYDWFQPRLQVLSPDDDVDVIIGREQIEKGNKATDWSLAPEDKASTNELISLINVSPESITIASDKVDIQGIVSFINADGSSATMIDGDRLTTRSIAADRIVSSTITANELNINSIFANSAVIEKIQADSVATANISAGQITAGTLDASKVSVVNLNASNIKSGVLNSISISASEITGAEIRGGRLSGSSTTLDLDNGTFLSRQSDLETTFKDARIVFKDRRSEYESLIQISSVRNNGVYYPQLHLESPSLINLVLKNYGASQSNSVQYNHSGSTGYSFIFNDALPIARRVYQNTYTANNSHVRVEGTGILGMINSSRKFKLCEEVLDTDYAKRLFNLQPKSWFDKRATEDYAHTLSTGEETEVQKIERIPGLIAEDVEEAGLEMFVSYDINEEPTGINDNLWTLLIPIVKQHKKEIEQLKQENKELKRLIAN